MPHHTVYVPPVESIEEVNISTNDFDAEQGMTGGAAVTVITKSGTNHFHGTAFAIYNNNALRTTPGTRIALVLKEKPKASGISTETALADPSKEQAVFLHGLGRDLRTGGLLRAFSVPTADFRTGDFNRMLGAGVLNASGAPSWCRRRKEDDQSGKE